jgi:hypothetical protein
MTMCWRNTPSVVKPATPQHLEGVARQEEDRLGRLRRALQRAAEPDVADLDHAVLGLDAQEAHDAGREAARHVQDRVEVRIGRRSLGFQMT